MDPKELRANAPLSISVNDDNTKYSSPTLSANKNKLYHEIGGNSMGKMDVAAVRPCAIIGPDRVHSQAPGDAYVKKASVEPWPYPENIYRPPPDYPNKLLDYQPNRNISPRQTFQENMQRIMVPPNYSSVKNSDEASLKNNKINVPHEAKYCDVPYNVTSITNEHKSARNFDIPMSSVNPAFARSVPPYGWPAGVNIRPQRPYGAPEFYHYTEYPTSVGPRPPTLSQHRIHREEAQAYSERLYQEANIRFKPYPIPKEKHQQARYDYNINNYPNNFHPPATFPPHKSIHNHPYPVYPQVPLKFLDRRVHESFVDGYQRSNQQVVFNSPYHNQMIPPPYGPVSGNCVQNKPFSELSPKPTGVNKFQYDANNKIYLDLDTSRNKGYPVPENVYYNDMNQHMRGEILLPNHPTVNMHPIPKHQPYRRDSVPLKHYEYNPHYRNIDPSINLNYSLTRLPLQYSPNSIAISPSDSNTSNDTTHTMGTSQEDCGYVSQSSTTSVRSLDTGNISIQKDIYRRQDYHPISRQNSSSKTNLSSKKNINVRQFLQMWNEGEEEATESNKEIPQVQVSHFNSKPETNSSQEQLYVLGLVNVPNEDLSKYEHIQKISKLPENIKGYNSIEILNQFEKLLESPNANSYKIPPKLNKEHFSSTKRLSEKELPTLPRPVSPLDVEAKISQSVIHKEVGCNFEIKPCSPEMMNVEVATPIQSILGERIIEKVANPITAKSPMLKSGDNNVNLENNKITSCDMINNKYPASNYPNLIRNNNYTVQDFESNSGICLASLPRLDNDIEFNFPEINQQFIKANQIDEKSQQSLPQLNADPTDHTENSFLNQNTISPQPAIGFGLEKEGSKLSKYRKNKKPDLTPKENIQEQNNIVIAQQRIDSVIIKNPETVRSQEDNDISFLTVNKTPNENISPHSIEASSLEEERILSFETAIDFSLSKTDEATSYECINKTTESNYFTNNISFDSKDITDKNTMAETSLLDLHIKNTKEYETFDEPLNFDIRTEFSNNKIIEDSVISIPPAIHTNENIHSSVAENITNINHIEDNTAKQENNSLIPEENGNPLSETFNINSVDLEEDMKFAANLSTVNNNTLGHQIVKQTNKKEIEGVTQEGKETVGDTKRDEQGIDVINYDADEKKGEEDNKLDVVNNMYKNGNDDEIKKNKTDGGKINIKQETDEGKLFKIKNESQTVDKNSDCETKLREKEINFKYEICETKTENEIDNKTKVDEKENYDIHKIVKTNTGSESQINEKDVEYETNIVVKGKDGETRLNKKVTNNNINVSERATAEGSQIQEKEVDRKTEILEEDLDQTIKIDNISDQTIVSQSQENNCINQKVNEIINICKINPNIAIDISNNIEINHDIKKVIEEKDHVENVNCEENANDKNNKKSDLHDIHKSKELEVTKSYDDINKIDYIKSSECMTQKESEELHITKCKIKQNNVETESANDLQVLISPNHSDVEIQLRDNITNNIKYCQNVDTMGQIKQLDFLMDNSHTGIKTYIPEPQPSIELLNLPIEFAENNGGFVCDSKTNQTFIVNDNKCDKSSLFIETEMKPKNDTGKIIQVPTGQKRKIYFRKKLYSPWIQKLFFFTEGICKIQNDETEKNKTPTNDIESYHLSIKTVNAVKDENFVEQCETNEKINNTHNDYIEANAGEALKAIAIIQEKDEHKVFIDKIEINENGTNNEQLYNLSMKDNNYLKEENFVEQCQIYEETNCTETNCTKVNADKTLRVNSILQEKDERIEISDRGSSSDFKVNSENNEHSISKSSTEFPSTIRRNTLKRSLSESALEDYKEDANAKDLTPSKRKKGNLITPLISEDLCNMIQTHRRNSISTIYNDENVYILIDNDFIITEENDNSDKIYYTEMAEECDENGSTIFDTESTVITEPIIDESNVICENSNYLHEIEEEPVQETWVEDVACIETVVSDDITEDIEEVMTPKEYDLEDDTIMDKSVIYCDKNHLDKIKDIYGTNMCNNDTQILQTLYMTPQMNVNKTLSDIESHNLEQLENKSMDNSIENHTNDFLEKLEKEILAYNNGEIIDEKENISEEDAETLKVQKKYFVVNDDSCVTSEISEDKEESTGQSCETSNDYYIRSPKNPESNYSSSPEVSSTTSEERNSSILLKITNYNGSRVSELNESGGHVLDKISCKLTEKNEYQNYSCNFRASRTLITKAAQKYIPPLKETIGDLKVKLTLPQHRLRTLKQLKTSKVEPKIIENIKIIRCFDKKQKPEVPKKQKPKFEDVLKSIDEIQFKKHKDKIKKGKNVIPKVVIKKNENGAHYASSKTTTTKESYNPDLTGRKWQPWVFLEKNSFIDKMAIRKKVKAIYCHRKNNYVLAEKFRKYKSVYNANFVITQPSSDSSAKGNLKYTIRLKHK